MKIKFLSTTLLALTLSTNAYSAAQADEEARTPSPALSQGSGTYELLEWFSPHPEVALENTSIFIRKEDGIPYWNSEGEFVIPDTWLSAQLMIQDMTIPPKGTVGSIIIEENTELSGLYGLIFKADTIDQNGIIEIGGNLQLKNHMETAISGGFTLTPPEELAMLLKAADKADDDVEEDKTIVFETVAPVDPKLLQTAPDDLIFSLEGCTINTPIAEKSEDASEEKAEDTSEEETALQ
ncbi:MAG: hypothetical protein WCG05_02375 [Alphaproteobacteria bacterium]